MECDSPLPIGQRQMRTVDTGKVISPCYRHNPSTEGHLSFFVYSAGVFRSKILPVSMPASHCPRSFVSTQAPADFRGEVLRSPPALRQPNHAALCSLAEKTPRQRGSPAARHRVCYGVIKSGGVDVSRKPLSVESIRRTSKKTLDSASSFKNPLKSATLISGKISVMNWAAWPE